MIVKGIVENVIDRHNIKVRIPFLNGAYQQTDATPTDQLPNATICQLPNLDIQLSTGDVVWIEFENMRWDEPVIVGFLDIKQNTKVTYNGSGLNITAEANLPKSTTIGDVTSESINCLKGVKDNIADYLTNTMWVYPLDLRSYNVTTTNNIEVPISVIQSIPEQAFVIAITTNADGNDVYWFLLSKTKITQPNDAMSMLQDNMPQYNYIFYNAYGTLTVEGQETHS